MRRCANGDRSSANGSPIESASGRPLAAAKWRLDEVVVSIAVERRWLGRAVDQNGFVLDVLIQRRRDTRAAQRLMRRLLKSPVTPPRVMITDKPRSYGASKAKMDLRVEHRQPKFIASFEGAV
jgi:putative transposase